MWSVDDDVGGCRSTEREKDGIEEGERMKMMERDEEEGGFRVFCVPERIEKEK